MLTLTAVHAHSHCTVYSTVSATVERLFRYLAVLNIDLVTKKESIMSAETMEMIQILNYKDT